MTGRPRGNCPDVVWAAGPAGWGIIRERRTGSRRPGTIPIIPRIRPPPAGPRRYCGPARPDAGTARSASVHRAAVPGHRMPACHRAVQAARNHIPGHGPRMRRHPESERNPRSSHPAGSRFGLPVKPSGVSAGPPADWMPSGHPGVKSRPSPPPTCQWTDGRADRPGRQTPGTGQPPTSDDMMPEGGPQEQQDVPAGGGPPGPAGTPTPERAAPKTPGPSPAGTRATGHPGRPKRQTLMAGRHRHTA